MTATLEIEPPVLADYQRRILDSPARYTITEAATKIGKTFSHLWWLFRTAHEPPKYGANYWWVAPVFAQAKIAFTRMRRVVAASGAYKINESELYIQTPAGSTIWFKSAEKPDNLYGEDVYAAVFDEFTRAREEAWTALRTTLTSTQGPCKFIGNVRGKKNWGYKLGQRARAGEPGYEYFKITARDAVKAGILDTDEIQQAQRDLPEAAFRQLYLAEAVDDGANPFGLDFIARQVKPKSDQPVVAYGIDLAKSVDWTVVIGLDGQGRVATFDRWQGDWMQTRSRIVKLVAGKRGLIDSTGVGDPIAEDIIRACPGIQRYHFTATSKQQLMEGLAGSIQKGEVSVLAGVMREEMEAFEFTYSSSGVKYSAPEGSHDDCVCALALANYCLHNRPAGLRIVTGDSGYVSGNGRSNYSM